MQKDLFNLTRWNLEVSEAPSAVDLMIVYKDESGDRPVQYIMMGWKTSDGEHWIADNEEISAASILAWAPFPVYEDLFTI